MNNLYTITSNKLIANGTFEMILKGDTSKIKNPGQFIDIKIDDSNQYLLRRPMSIHNYSDTELSIIYKVIGNGTKILSQKQKDEILDILCPLGNGFTINTKLNNQCIIGGGLGIPPLYDVAKQLNKNSIDFTIILGVNTKEDLFKVEEFKKLSKNIFICTMDGSYGYHGNVLDCIKDNNINIDYYYACGPKGMLDALVKTNLNGQLSYEERMGCGFGACMGCSCKTTNGYKRICKEGPVLESKEVIIDE